MRRVAARTSAFSTASSVTPRSYSWAASTRSGRRTAPEVDGVARSAGRGQPATPAAAAACAARGLANVPSAGRVGETPVASSPAWDSVCSLARLVSCGGRGGVSGSPVGSIRCGLNWSFVVRRISASITPMKSAPCALNWSFATHQGSRFNGGGNRSGGDG